MLSNNTGVPQLNFFYTGRHYAALFASLPAPYSWNYTTFTLSTIGNISDRSFVSRLDYSLTVLTHLSFEAFAAVHFGYKAGEFRLGADFAEQTGAQSRSDDAGELLHLPRHFETIRCSSTSASRSA